MKKSLLFPVFVLLAVVAAGCAGRSTQQYVHFPDQTVAIENQEKARIYVLRPSKFAFGISMAVYDGDILVGHTGPAGYLCWERAPGQVEITGRAENSHQIPVTMEIGNNYYILQRPYMGVWKARNELRLLSEAEGQAELMNCRQPVVRIRQ